MKLVFATGNKGKLREAAEILGPGFELLSSAEAGVVEDVEETGATLKENSIIKAQYIWGRTGLDCFADDTGLEVDALDGAPGVFTARFAGPACNFDDNIAKLLRELSARGAVLPSAPAEVPSSLAGSSVAPSGLAGSAGVPAAPLRTARFRSVVTLILGGEVHYFEGVMEGCIALEKAGCGGFGYDPVFIPHITPELLRSLPPKAAAELLATSPSSSAATAILPTEPFFCTRTVAELSEETKNAISHRGKALRAMAAWLQEASLR